MKRSFALCIFFLTGWLLTACDTKLCGCTTFDLGIEVAIEDAAGNDLLDPDTDGHLEEQDFTLYHEIKGRLEKYEWKHEGVGIVLYTEEDNNRLNIASNPTRGNNIVTVLRVKDHTDIRIVTKVNGEDGARVEKVWYKDQLVWSVDGNNFPRTITVTLD